MPRNALEHVAVDCVLPVDEIGRKLARVAAEPIPRATAAPPAMAAETAIELRGNGLQQGVLDLGRPVRRRRIARRG